MCVSLSNYITLCKPRVVMLMILTSMVGMSLVPTIDFSWEKFWWGNIGIALMACSAAVVNHLADQRIDRLMRRTQHRPIASYHISNVHAAIFSAVMGVSGFILLVIWVNTLTAFLTFCALIGYAVIYTLYLKYATAQNIVIGGLAGAAPPLLGWVAMTGHVDFDAIVLLLIIFVWTPPHFWALAIDRVDEYAKAGVPMLPVTRGIAYTKLHIVWYVAVLCAVSLLPFVVHLSGWIYLSIALMLNMRFLMLALQLHRSDNPLLPKKVFQFSIVYLMGLFLALLMDRFF
ncbi:MAG: protoheme IX farnesyltransferase [Gammaproteobacteria bacterium RIFCSPLOWO2_02_FULL_42_14]|nr:MAG: protoheme IX farnesyltransferase [Gammaproteobacteria bacterium RIFCSPHIGHO2_02_FULL_42_43]OGT53155.1 MAG: protoheme IX farnesyltransferase [Gammaproteobacteria bacterium RIFCSPHIGHO2_12_FULL_41_25]OGT60984.1 MAG: protoheme IX farnesyltransferase [Gammaproteobacteria bacterium RIFCSPLOWO2_02_FULL_42_14]OGT85300.1 MAG: protoheme IX farnesyltransferase [Gammaproteobacteria bacterium RIFCSPLOWO2_12_FULL_42_18]